MTRGFERRRGIDYFDTLLRCLRRLVRVECFFVRVGVGSMYFLWRTGVNLVESGRGCFYAVVFGLREKIW